MHRPALYIHLLGMFRLECHGLNTCPPYTFTLLFSHYRDGIEVDARNLDLTTWRVYITLYGSISADVRDMCRYCWARMASFAMIFTDNWILAEIPLL